jgi:hypothetical protein
MLAEPLLNNELTALIILIALCGTVTFASKSSGESLTADFFQESHDDVKVKSIMHNTLANAAIVSALILSIVISMLQADCPPHADEESVAWRVYLGMTYISAGFSVQAVVASSIILMYTEPLCEEDAKVYLKEDPKCLGYPVSCMAVASLLLCLQACLYCCIGMNSSTLAVFIGILVASPIINVTIQWRNCTIFKAPTRSSNKEMSDDEKQKVELVVIMQKNPGSIDDEKHK